MADLGTLIVGLLANWNQEQYVLLRIRILVVILTFMYYMMLAMSVVLEFVSRSNALRAMDAVCDTLLVYVMGAMQASPKNQMFPIWAVYLVGFRSIVNTMSKSDTYFELRNMLKLWAAALLNLKHGSRLLRAPFWLLWGILFVKSLFRIRACKIVSKSLWHGRSSALVQEYMGAVDHNLRNFNPATLEGCKFLVYGELKKNITNGLGPSIDDLKSVVTLDNIWLHDGSPLLRIIIKRQKNTIKDLTLAFALSRLLRCRMEGGRLHEDTISMTRELICLRIIRTEATDDDDGESVLTGILQMELSFLGQQIHTGYPVVFCQGLRSLLFFALLFVVQTTCILWLGSILRDSNDVITVLPLGMAGIMIFIELLIYMSSKWTILLLACNYVSCRGNKHMEHVFRTMILSAPYLFTHELVVLCTSRHDFLQSASYSEGKLRLGPYDEDLLSGRLIRWKRWDTVIAAVIRALARYMDEESSRLPSHCLPSPRVSERVQRYWSACLELPSCSHVILVWHIATGLCQVKLKQDRGITNSTRLFRFFVGNTRHDLAGNLKKSNMVANCLSRYCLDLLISKPNLLPDNVFASKKLLSNTIQHAHEILRGCSSPQSKYDKLIALLQEAAVPEVNRQDIQLTGNILIQGAMMGKELIDSEDEEGLWEILAVVWADILIQIAPSSKAEAHGKGLQFGPELLTVIWALLCHCGIEKSELWPEER